jgi:hypothetical protein
MMATWKRSISAFRRDQRGNTAVLFAMAMVPMTVLTGGTVDYGRVLSERARLQAAGDAAAIAGSSLLGATEAERAETTRKVFAANFSGTVEPQIKATAKTVELTARIDVKTPFLNLISIPSMQANAYAIAAGTDIIRADQTAKACLLALDPESDDGIHIQGSNRVSYENCWAHTNSAKPTAINGTSSTSSAVGAGHCAVGGWVDEHASFGPQQPKPGCLEVSDPFATKSAYSATDAYQATFPTPFAGDACKANKLVLKKGSFILEPGRYCGGLEIQAGASATFGAGTYHIDNGQLNVQAGATAIGSNVLFYLDGAASSFALRGGGRVELAGRTEGDHAGFLLIMHPDANRMGNSIIQGGGVFRAAGMVYAPTQRIEVSGNGDVNTDGVDIFGMVAKDFFFRGNGIFRLVKPSGGSIPDIMPVLPVLASRVSVIRQ